VLELDDEISQLDSLLDELLTSSVPTLLGIRGWDPRQRAPCWGRPEITLTGFTASRVSLEKRKRCRRV
jgi:hypothetical protein